MKNLVVAVCLVVLVGLLVPTIHWASQVSADETLAIVETPDGDCDTTWVLERAKWESPKLRQMLSDNWEPFGVDRNYVYFRKQLTVCARDE